MAAPKGAIVLAALLVAGTVSSTYGQCCSPHGGTTFYTTCQYPNAARCSGASNAYIGTPSSDNRGRGGTISGDGCETVSDCYCLASYPQRLHYLCGTQCNCLSCEARQNYQQNGRYHRVGNNGGPQSQPICDPFQYCMPPDNNWAKPPQASGTISSTFVAGQRGWGEEYTPVADPSVLITENDVRMDYLGIDYFAVTVKCSPSYTILSGTQSTQASGTSPLIGGTPIAVECARHGSIYSHQSCAQDCTTPSAVASDASVLVTETSLSSFEDLFAVSVACVGDKDGAPNPEVCPSPGTPWTYNQCWTDCTSPDGSTNNVVGGAYTPTNDESVIIHEKRISHSSSSNSLPEFTLAGERLFDVQVTCAGGYSGTPKATSCTTEGQPYTYTKCYLDKPIQWEPPPPPPGVPPPPPTPPPQARQPASFWPPPPASPVATPPGAVEQITLSVALPAGTDFIKPGYNVATVSNVVAGSTMTLTEADLSADVFTTMVTDIATDGTIIFSPFLIDFAVGTTVEFSAPSQVKAAVAAASPGVAMTGAAAWPTKQQITTPPPPPTDQPADLAASADVARTVLAAAAVEAVEVVEVVEAVEAVNVADDAESNTNVNTVSVAAATTGKGGKGKKGHQATNAKEAKAKKAKAPKEPSGKGGKKHGKSAKLKSGTSKEGMKDNAWKALGIVAFLAAFVAGAVSLAIKRRKELNQPIQMHRISLLGPRSVANVEDDVLLPKQMDEISHLSPRRRNVPMTPNTPKGYALL